MRRAWKGSLWTLAALGACAAGAFFVLRSRGAESQAPPASSAKPRARAAPVIAESIYDASLKPGWTDGGWGPREVPASGPVRVNFEGFGGLVLEHAAALGAGYGALTFRVKAPSSFGEFLKVSLRLVGPGSEAAPHVDVTSEHAIDLPDGYREVSIPFRSLNPEGADFTAIVLQARQMVRSEWVLLDKIALTKADADSLAGGAPRRAAALAVDCRAAVTPISPLVYGIAAGVVSSGESAHRVGGNTTTRLNWDLGDVWNTGSDWYFENVKGDSSLRSWLDKAQQVNLQMALTVPLIGWVAKDSTSVGFPRSRFGQQQKHDPGRPEAGNGFSPRGTPLEPGPPSLTSEPAPPERIKRWVTELRERDRQSGKRSVHLYLLDNEPDLWHKTHRDVHPEPLGYDELLDRTVRYATAVREADPEAKIAGPASWGWTGYFYSAKDQEAGFLLQPDRRAHGGTPLIPWYLQQLAAHEKRTGVRLLDVLDVHYYPQGEKVYGPDADASTAALRLRSTRSLWDPSYVDESWIKDRVRLLPRLREWIDQSYPGLGISIGEWSFGAEQHVSGALATAEALGRFGQHGVTAAFYWRSPEASTATYQAFRAYRNYDGKGARFLDYSLKTSGTPQVSLFGSRDESGQRFVLLLLNLDPSVAAEVAIDLGTCGALRRRRSFSYAASTRVIVEDPPLAEGTAEAQAVLAPYSIKIIELTRPP